MANRLKKNKVKKKWSKKKKITVTVVVIALIVAWVIIKNVQARKQQQQVANIKVTSVENMTPVQKQAYELTNKLGQFYFLDKNTTVEEVNSLKDIFSPQVQKEIKIDTDESIEKHVEKVKKINDETKFIEAINPKILTSNDNTVVLLVDLIVDVVSSDKREPGKYDATVMVAVENGKVAAFKLEGIKKMQ